MHIFAAKRSEFPNVATSHTFAREPQTVDLGITINFATMAHTSPADILVVAKDLGSDAAIDNAVDQLIEHLNDVRTEAKQLLAKLKA